MTYRVKKKREMFEEGKYRDRERVRRVRER